MISKLIKYWKFWVFVLILHQIVVLGGCFALSCILIGIINIGVIAFLLSYFSTDDNKQDNKQDDFFKDVFDEDEDEEIKVEQHPLKTKGDEYEKYIGKKFEEKGELVIYNGFIKGYGDKGVDLISINNKTYNINLIQCKNWTNKPIHLEDIQEIYNKLSQYDFDFFDLPAREINKYLQLKREESNIRNILKNVKQNLEKFTIRKTLYIGSDNVINLNIGKYLTMIKPNIFKYNDMKIVVYKMNS